MKPRLTPKQCEYVSCRLKGYQPTAAARLAGYADNGGSMIRVTAFRLEQNNNIKTCFQNATNQTNARILRRVKKGIDVSVADLQGLLGWTCLSSSGLSLIQNKLANMGYRIEISG